MYKLFFALCFFVFVSCGHSGKGLSDKNSIVFDDKVVAIDSFISVDSLLGVPFLFVNKPVYVYGIVDHVCRHTGKRFKIAGSSSAHNEIKVELDDDFGLVNDSIAGKDVFVNGILVGVNYDVDMMKAWIEKVRINHRGEEGTEHFKHEIAELEGILSQINDGQIQFYTVFNIKANNYIVR